MRKASKPSLTSLLVSLVWLLGACVEANLKAGSGDDREAVVEAVPEAVPETGPEAVRDGDPEAGKLFFESVEGGNCKTCHYTSKLRMVGPGMESVTKRHTEAWLRMWLTDPQGTWRSDHPETEELKSRTRKGRVPVTSCVKKPMTEGQVDDLISFLKTLEKE